MAYGGWAHLVDRLVDRLRCRIPPFIDQGGTLRAPRAGASAGLRPWEAPAGARRPNALAAADHTGFTWHAGVLDGTVFLGDSIVPLPAAASRSLPAVASHAIGFAEPRPGIRSPGIGACRGRRAGL